MNSTLENTKPLSLYALPSEILEKIFLLLSTDDLVRLYDSANDDVIVEISFPHFLHALTLTLKNVSLFASLRETSPVLTRAIRSEFRRQFRYAADGEKAQFLLQRLNRVVERGRYDHGREKLFVDDDDEENSLDNSPESFAIKFDASTNYAALVVPKNPSLSTVEILDDKLKRIRRLEIPRPAYDSAFLLFDKSSKLLWLERDRDSIYGFSRFKIQDFVTGERREKPVTRHFGLTRAAGPKRILVSSRFLVARDGLAFVVFSYPSLDYSFHRKCNIVDASLDGDFLYVVNRGRLSVWDLVQKKETKKDGVVVVGDPSTLRFPYIFYKNREENTPNNWYYAVINAEKDSPPKRLHLEMDTFNKIEYEGVSDWLFVRNPVYDGRYKIIHVSSQEEIGNLSLPEDSIDEDVLKIFNSGFHLVMLTRSRESRLFYLHYFTFRESLRNAINGEVNDDARYRV